MYIKTNYLLLFFAVWILTACSEDVTNEPPLEELPSKGMLVICQGNQFAGLTGTIDVVDFSSSNVTSNAFSTVNGEALGDTPQGGFSYKGTCYVPLFGSHLVRSVNLADLRATRTFRVASPEATLCENDRLYVACNGGYVSRFDLLAPDAQEERLNVGPNPFAMAASNDKLYVTVSDGYNYEGGYVNGKRVAVINLSDYSLERTISVGLNPGTIIADGKGGLYLIARGDYVSVQPVVQYIAPEGTVSTLCPGSLIALQGERLHVLDFTTDYVNDRTEVGYKTFSTTTREPLADITLDKDHLPAMPNALHVNSENGRIFICSDPSPNGYSLNGYVYEYASDGKFAHRYSVGVHPIDVQFF